VRSEEDRYSIPYGCNNCRQEGWIFPDSPQTTTFIICSQCRNEIAYAYCPECDIFTNFLAHSTVRRPTTWTCLECKKEYALSPDFYENPIQLYFEENLPENLKSQIKIKMKRQLIVILSALGLIVVLILKELLF